MNFNFDDKNDKNDKDDRPPKNSYDKILKIVKNTLIAALVILGLFLFFNYLFVWFLPFIIAWIIAFFIQPVVRFLNSSLRTPKKIATLVVLLLIFAIIGTLIFVIVDRLIYELTALSGTFKIDGGAITQYTNDFFAWFDNVLDNIPFLAGDDTVIDQIRIQIDSIIETFAADIGSLLASKVPAFITSVVVTLPSFVVFAVILIVSTFYICFDYAYITKFIMMQIPKKVTNVILDIKNRFVEAIVKYLRAYLIILFITYSELVTGFLIIGIKYAFLLAFFVALLDIFPVVGTGTVLIPWGIINILQQDYFRGFSLLILYATITIIRQIIEPKIVGKSLGLYPVVTLIALYVGFNMFGFFGMIFLPVCILLIKNLNEEGRIHLWKNIDKEDKKNKKDKKSDDVL